MLSDGSGLTTVGTAALLGAVLVRVVYRGSAILVRAGLDRREHAAMLGLVGVALVPGLSSFLAHHCHSLLTF